MSKGVLYLASGSSYIKKAAKSARSVKTHNPSLKVTIYTDERVDKYDIFDDVITASDPIEGKWDASLSEKHFPYEKNLYLDADTYVTGDIMEMFEVLDQYNLAMAQSPGGTMWNKDLYDHNNIDIPDSFTEYNAGVIAYNDCKEVRQLFSKWNDIFEEMDYTGHISDQASLRAALWESDVSMYTLPSKYNFTLNQPPYARGKIKILHQSGGSKAELEKFDKLLNSTQDGRVITYDDYPCRVVPIKKRGKRYKIKRLLLNKEYQRELARRIKNKIETEGVFSLVKTGIAKIYN